MASSEDAPGGVDWARVENVVALCQHAQAVLPETKAALKLALRGSDVRHILLTFTVLDSVAINTNREIRRQLASKGWMRLLSSLAATEAPCVGPAAAQLLTNWRLMFTGEELGAAAYTACRALQAREDFKLPAPSHFAYQLREIIEQGIPFIGLQRGTDFLTSYLPAAFPASPAAGQQAGPDAGSRRQSSSSPPAAGPPGDPRAAANGGSMPLPKVRDRAEEMREGAARLRQCVERGQAAQAAGWADCCTEWRQEIRACVAEEVTDAALAALLEANDALNAALRLWQHSREQGPGSGAAALSPQGSVAASTAAADWCTPPGQAREHAASAQGGSPLEAELHRLRELLRARDAEAQGLRGGIGKG
ncbi:hypothetical protein WJX81_004883 [Elliptochloris bilobata]|uniref:VHS domain-containing protein n=1 Tax=Elliptochloris bilobata TaxID=381761 RepID=A0AAW1RX08_9CHLO